MYDFWYTESALLHFSQRVVPRTVQSRRQVTQMPCLLQNDRTILLGFLPCLSIGLTIALREEIVLNLDEFNGRRTRLIVIDDVIDPLAYWVTPHQICIVGLQ